MTMFNFIWLELAN